MPSGVQRASARQLAQRSHTGFSESAATGSPRGSRLGAIVSSPVVLTLPLLSIVFICVARDAARARRVVAERQTRCVAAVHAVHKDDVALHHGHAVDVRAFLGELGLHARVDDALVCLLARTRGACAERARHARDGAVGQASGCRTLPSRLGMLVMREVGCLYPPPRFS